MTRSRETSALRSRSRRTDARDGLRRAAGRRRAERTRFARNTSFAALRGARTQPGGPDVSFGGADGSPSPPSAGGPADGAPLPTSSSAPYGARTPHCLRQRGPGVLREARTADGRAETWSLQTGDRADVPADSRPTRLPADGRLTTRSRRLPCSHRDQHNRRRRRRDLLGRVDGGGLDSLSGALSAKTEAARP